MLVASGGTPCDGYRRLPRRLKPRYLRDRYFVSEECILEIYFNIPPEQLHFVRMKLGMLATATTYPRVLSGCVQL